MIDTKDWTVSKVYQTALNHQLAGVMFHSDSHSYLRYLGLPNLAKLHCYQKQEELENMDKTVNSYLTHHNMLMQADNSKVIKIVPADVYTTSADKVGTDFKRKAVNKILETWLEWEAQTAELYTAITCWLMNQHKADYLHFQKLLKDVCHEHEKAKCIYSHAELVGWDAADIESFACTVSA